MDELLYYSRDENQFLRRRRTVRPALSPDLVETRFKDFELPYQRGVMLHGAGVRPGAKLIEWLQHRRAELPDPLPGAAAICRHWHNAAILEKLFMEEITQDTVHIGRYVPSKLAKSCEEWLRRTMVHVLMVGVRRASGGQGGRRAGWPSTAPGRNWATASRICSPSEGEDGRKAGPTPCRGFSMPGSDTKYRSLPCGADSRSHAPDMRRTGHPRNRYLHPDVPNHRRLIRFADTEGGGDATVNGVFLGLLIPTLKGYLEVKDPSAAIAGPPALTIVLFLIWLGFLVLHQFVSVHPAYPRTEPNWSIGHTTHFHPAAVTRQYPLEEFQRSSMTPRRWHGRAKREIMAAILDPTRIFPARSTAM